MIRLRASCPWHTSVEEHWGPNFDQAPSAQILHCHMASNLVPVFPAGLAENAKAGEDGFSSHRSQHMHSIAEMLRDAQTISDGILASFTTHSLAALATCATCMQREREREREKERERERELASGPCRRLGKVFSAFDLHFRRSFSALLLRSALLPGNYKPPSTCWP